MVVGQGGGDARWVGGGGVLKYIILPMLLVFYLPLNNLFVVSVTF